MPLHLPTLAELKNVQRELELFQLRLWIMGLLVAICFLVLIARLMYLQIALYDDLFERAENNRTAVIPIVPTRGEIRDRNGVVLASNYSAYTLEITPSKVPDLEATLDALSELITIEPRDRRRFKRLREESRNFDSLPIRTRLSDAEVARFAAERYRFPGVEIRARLFREYPLGDVASHVIGYIGRINAREKELLEDDEEMAANYRGTDYIGKLGIEQSYESQLHGITGYQQIETSAGGKAVRRLTSKPATPGHNLTLTLDIELQALVERLFDQRRGALVAIDPQTGEVLALVSKPTFDPNLFVEGIDQDSWSALNESLDKPLLNRALRGTYPPGSTYKPFMALAALQTGKRSAATLIYDGGSWTFGNHTFRSHGDTGLGSVDMVRSIAQSSNVYYYSLANEMGVDAIHDFMALLGFGQLSGIDLPGEVRGILPSTEWKARTYKKPEQKQWYAGETISLGIGQGYNSFTMLQLAQATATLANGGVRHTPRLLRSSQDPVHRGETPYAGPPPQNLGFNADHIAVVHKGMVGVVREGTAAKVFAGTPYVSAGKTGTAQAVTIGQKEKYNAARLSEYQRDHSLYMAFAPVDQPKIALAVVVENAGFGAAHAAPIARKVFDYWLLGRLPGDDEIRGLQPMAASPVKASEPEKSD